jgi:hypothetical protein
MSDRVKINNCQLVLLFCMLMLSCNSRKPIDNIPEPVNEVDWTHYEGRVPLDDKRSLYLEVALLSGTMAGEGIYRLQETLEEENGRNQLSELTGSYSTHSDDDQQLIVQLHNSALTEGVRRTYITNNGKTLREEILRNTDLHLRREGDRTLVVLNYRMEPVSLEHNDNLIKRSSRIFTIEGYFRHTVDSAVFFEVNTKERWAVSKRGAYDQAAREYHMLVREKFDSVFLKAIGYSIRQINRKGKEVEALVLKRILQTTSPPVIDAQSPMVVN